MSLFDINISDASILADPPIKEAVMTFESCKQQCVNDVMIYANNTLIYALMMIFAMSASIFFFVYFRRKYPEFYEANITWAIAIFSISIAVIILWLIRL